MKHNTLIGILLVGLILVGFSWYNTKQSKQQQEYNRVQDSIATQRAVKYASELAKQGVDPSVVAAVAAGQTVAVPGAVNATTTGQYTNIYTNELLEASYSAEEEFFTLENEEIEVVYTTKGAQAYKVRIKEFHTYDSLPLYLMKEHGSNLNIQLYTDQLLNTSDFTFKKVAQTDTSLVMRLYFSENSYLEHLYTLSEGSYMVDFYLNMVGMESIIPRNVTQLDLTWDMDIPRLEKGYDNEKNYSTIVYKYADEASVEDLGFRKDESDETINTKFNWFAFQDQFFSAILLAENNFSSGALTYRFFPEGDPKMNLMACTANVQVPYESGNNATIPFKFYYGPNDFKTLKSYDYGFQNIVPLGGWVIGWINRFVIIPIFDFLGKYISNYGIIILLLTIIIKLVIFPLTFKSYMSSAKMRVLKPEIDKISEKYPKQEDAMKKQQEVMALYKRCGVSMFGGCLPMLIQFPILFAMFRFFPASFELRQQSFLWAKDLSSYDSILNLPFTIPLYGDHVSLFAILMAISMYFYSRMNADQMSAGPQMAGMKFMTLYFMPVFMLVICNNFSSGLSYYYMLSNVITIIQTWVIRKYFVDEDKIFAQLKAKSAKAVDKPKSKFQQRLEAAAKAQEEMRKQRKK